MATLLKYPEKSKETQSDICRLWLVEPQMCCCSLDLFIYLYIYFLLGFHWQPCQKGIQYTYTIREQGGGLNRGLTS